MLGFIGAKGGVGTTTVALNVALALLKRGKRVIPRLVGQRCNAVTLWFWLMCHSERLKGVKNLVIGLQFAAGRRDSFL